MLSNEELILSRSVIGFDGEWCRHCEYYLAVASTPDGLLRFNDREAARSFLNGLSKDDILSAHYGRADWRALNMYPEKPTVYDSLTLGWLIDEEPPHGLKVRGPKFLGRPFDDPITIRESTGESLFNGKHISEADQDEVFKYCAADSRGSADLTIQHLCKLSDELLKWYRGVEVPMDYVLWLCETRGIAVNEALMQQETEKLRPEVAALIARLYAMVGYEFNVNSPAQLGNVLYKTEYEVVLREKQLVGTYKTCIHGAKVWESEWAAREWLSKSASGNMYPRVPLAGNGSGPRTAMGTESSGLGGGTGGTSAHTELSTKSLSALAQKGSSLTTSVETGHVSTQSTLSSSPEARTYAGEILANGSGGRVTGTVPGGRCPQGCSEGKPKYGFVEVPEMRRGLGLKAKKTTNSGDPSTDKEALQAHVGHPVIDVLLEYSMVNTALGYLEQYPQFIKGGRIRGQFKQAGTVTGRLSSSEPNLQNIPRRGELGKRIRKLFVAEPGNKLVVADLDQLEYRILAALSGETKLIEAFVAGEDIHQRTATIMGVESRDVGKTGNYAAVYECGPNKFAQLCTAAGMPTTADQAKALLELYYQQLPMVLIWKNGVKRDAARYGFVRTVGGRLRHLDDATHKDQGLRQRALRQAVNSVIQGSAADLVKLWMVYMQHRGVPMLAQIHDEVIAEVPAEQAEATAKVMVECLTAAGKRLGLTRVPMTTTPKISDNWGAAK